MSNTPTQKYDGEQIQVLEGLEGGGLAVTDYGEHWISQYPFYLYRMEHKE